MNVSNLYQKSELILEVLNDFLGKNRWNDENNIGRHVHRDIAAHFEAAQPVFKDFVSDYREGGEELLKQKARAMIGGKFGYIEKAYEKKDVDVEATKKWSQELQRHAESPLASYFSDLKSSTLTLNKILFRETDLNLKMKKDYLTENDVDVNSFISSLSSINGEISSGLNRG